jgi:hypothetical protein
MRISMSMTPTTIRAGQVGHFTVSVTGPDQDCCAVAIVWGDGQQDPGQVDCMTGMGNGSGAHVAYDHIYNKPGPHHFLLQGISGGCNHNGEVYGTLDVGPGTSTSQGPALPVVEASQSTRPVGHENDGSWVSAYGHAADRDGYITSMVITWGDGTSSTYPGDPGPCQRGTDGWPAGSEATLPGDSHPPAHHYTHPGDYTVTITATSTGCDGKQPQKGHATFPWSWQPPQSATPTPTPS